MYCGFNHFDIRSVHDGLDGCDICDLVIFDGLNCAGYKKISSMLMSSSTSVGVEG
jgi:hypothetical protein